MTGLVARFFSVLSLSVLMAGAGVGCAQPGQIQATDSSTTLDNVPSETARTASETGAVSSTNQVAQFFGALEGEWVLVRGETRELDPQGSQQGATKVRVYGEAFFKTPSGWSFNGETCNRDQDGAEFCQEHNAGWEINGQTLQLVIPGDRPFPVKLVTASPTALEYVYEVEGTFYRRSDRLLPNGRRIERSTVTYPDGSRTATILETKKKI